MDFQISVAIPYELRGQDDDEMDTIDDAIRGAIRANGVVGPIRMCGDFDVETIMVNGPASTPKLVSDVESALTNVWRTL